MKILISAYTGLGNFILKTPFIRSIKQEYPDCKVYLLCGSDWGVENVLETPGYIDKIYFLPKKSSYIERHLFFLKLKKIDIIFLPFDSTPGFVTLGTYFYMNKSQIVGHYNIHGVTIINYLKTILYLIFFTRCEWVPTIKGRHEIDLNYDLLQALLPKKLLKNYQTFVHWKNEIIKLPRDYIAIQVSAANGSLTSKTWNPKNFIALIKKCNIKYPGLNIILVGDLGDANILAGSEIFLIKKVFNLLGKTTFNQLCNVLKGAKIVIAHDSGIMHVANALQVPMIALYGPTDYMRTAPMARSSKVLHSRNDCWMGMYGFKGEDLALAKKYPKYYCMNAISTEQVLNTIDELLFNV
jgi:ADP-heptose:LPS heptosyltransferase